MVEHSAATRVVNLQPALHELVTVLAAPVTALSATSGDITGEGATGVFAADLRVLSRSLLTVDGRSPEPVAHHLDGAHGVEFLGVCRGLGDPGPDPTVWLRRRRTALRDGLREEILVENVGAGMLEILLELEFASDLAPIETVKLGGAGPAGDHETGFRVDAGIAVAELADVRIRIRAEGNAEATADMLRWSLQIPSRATASVGWTLTVQDPGAVMGPATRLGLQNPVVVADDARLGRIVARSVADLTALAAATVEAPADTVLTAGSPWYLTLFGRDSLWSARMTLPLGLGPARGTLRTLAARQGTRVDPRTAEQPGKILHELRRSAFQAVDAFLPPVYYGTVDATPLWICLLRDAWKWGLTSAEVRPLLDPLERALGWIRDHGDADGDGFLEYVDEAGGLTNQGWKDSGDSVRFADGTIATGPVALAEVQGYSYEAMLAGAELLAAFGRPGAVEWRRRAADLRANFRAHFWTEDELGPFPVLALDGAKRKVDSPASNMGHLLGTGILDPDEAAVIAARLVHPSMNSGFGLRTMSTTAGGYSPLSYHCGTVWPHDTAIAILGLVREGCTEQAAELARGLLTAADAFDGRLPELFGGFGIDDTPAPVPYPASCRPQAWAAAASVVLLQAFLGLTADVPAGTVTLTPAPLIGGFSVDGLEIAGQPWSVRVDRSGVAEASPLAGIEIRGL